MKRRNRCIFVFGLPAVLALAAPLIALGAAYEGFDYTPAGSDLSGRNGGSGFTGPWVPGGFNASQSENFDIADGSLSFGQLVTSGNRLQSGAVGSIAGLTRPLAEPLGTTGTTRYISFLLRPEGTLHGGAFNGFFGLVLEQPGEPELFVGKPGADQIDQYVLEERGGPLQVSTGTNAVVGETVFLVLKAEFTNGFDRFTLYVNPTPGGAEPAAGAVKQNSSTGVGNALTIYSTGAFSLDELRLGDTFADVTPIPEPAAGLGVALVSAAVVARRRRLRR